jgi:hypothetical protein
MKLGLLFSLLFSVGMSFAQPGEKGLLVTPDWAKNRDNL